MKNLLLIGVCVIVLGFQLETQAQGFTENALLFSRTQPGGSSRIQALGGAQVALGGDFSSGLSNPAGLGMYNRSEFTFSPAFNTYETSASHIGTKKNDSKNVLTIPGISLVYHYPQERNGFLGGSFGLTLTRINDFNRTFNYTGQDNASSIIDYFIEDANANFWEPRTELAYQNFLLEDSSYYGGDPNQYFSVMGLFPDDPGDIRELKRKESVSTRGSQYQWSFAYGGNLNDQFFFGASLGITTLRYQFNTTYKESDYAFVLSPDFDALDSLRMKESVTIDGSGVNLTLGVIYRPADFVQVGLSFVTPTVYELTDAYTASMVTYWNGYDYLDQGNLFTERAELTEPLVSEYRLTTPLKVSLGTAFFLGQYGFITGDVEFVNYSKAKYKSSIDDDFIEDYNPEIKSNFKNVVNYRLGAEFRYSIYRARVGYNYQANPYKKKFDVDQKIQTMSAGLGVKLNKYSVDATWFMSEGNSAYSPYSFLNNTGPVSNLKNKMNSVMVTVGYSF
jgi:hypothetical protein